MTAHLYKFRGNWKLILATGSAINQGVISETFYPNKTLAKQAAKQAGAKPHNY